MLFVRTRRFLKKFKRPKKRGRVVKAKLVFLDEAGGGREVFGMLLRVKVPYFLSHDKETKGHIVSIDDQLFFIPDKKDD